MKKMDFLYTLILLRHYVKKYNFIQNFWRVANYTFSESLEHKVSKK